MSDILTILVGCLTVLILLISVRIDQRMTRLEARLKELLPSREEEKSEHAA